MVLVADQATVTVLGEGSDVEAPPEIGTDYIDPAHAPVWGQKSHWRQPWRSFQVVEPAQKALDAIGINFNLTTTASCDHTARLLAAKGVKRARVEISWAGFTYADPTKLVTGATKNMAEAKLKALAKYGIRPLVLLNANHGAPCPNKGLPVEVTADAAVGATTVKINPKDLAAVVVGKTGFTQSGRMAYCLVKAKAEDGTLTLTRPLFAAIPKGAITMATLLYEPFRHPLLLNGEANPLFEGTMVGWEGYAKSVGLFAKGILGTDDFDMEVWNELSFGSGFLYIKDYYVPNDTDEIKGDTTFAILQRTIEMLANPANGLTNVKVGNGFANQTPFPAGSTSPLGLDGIPKHPYAGWRHFPAAAKPDGIRPVDALNGLVGHKNEAGNWVEDFTPPYDSFFPEYALCEIQTESLVRDLSPNPSKIGSVVHGRNTAPPGGTPPEMWVTEVNISDPPLAGLFFPGEISEADARHIETKAILRYLSAFLAKGFSALHLFACIGAGGTKGLIDATWWPTIVGAPATYPGDSAGGATVDAMGYFSAAMAGATAIAEAREIDISIITDYAENVQFTGNGTAQYPDLKNADVLAVFPFQVTAKKFVIPTYVMTRNIMQLHSAAEDPTRFDMPGEKYRIRFDGVVGTGATAAATDPLKTNSAVPVSIISASGSHITVEHEATDSPRLLTIQEA